MPPFDAQKHSPVQSLNRFAEQKIVNAAEVLAKSVPCSIDSVESNNAIVTVKVEIKQDGYVFPLIKCPVYGPEFVRWPLKKGQRGVLVSADYYIGAMSGLGTGTADMTPQFNLSTGVFVPIGNTSFADPDDPQMVSLYGPNGVSLRGGSPPAQSDATNFTADTTPRVTVDKDGFKVYINGTLKFIIDASGARYIGNPIPGGGNFGINVTPAGTLIDGVNFLPHQHVGVATGPNNTGAVDTIP